MEYKLMNLQIGENPQIRNFSVGPYQISLIAEYDKVQKELSTLKTETEKLENEDGKLIWNKVESREALFGKNHVTAYVSCDEEPESVFSLTPSKAIWDLCLILSFLSGHRVFLPKEARRYPHAKYRQSVVFDYEIPDASQQAWENRENFKTFPEMRPLWYFLHMNDNQHAEIMLLIGCVIIEIIINIEKDKEGSISPELAELLGTLQDNIENSSVDLNTKNKLKGTIGNWGTTNPVELFKNYLIKRNFVPQDIKGLPLERIKGINKFRNGIIHRGEIINPGWVDDDEIIKEVSIFISTMFIPALIEDYISNKFELDNFFWVRQTTDFIQEYIYHGTWNQDNIDGL